MPINARTKGKVAENEFAKKLNSIGLFNARRGCQYRGGPDTPDILCDGSVYWEVKRREKLDLSGSVSQAVRDSGHPNSGRTPAVASRKNNEGWLITIRFEDMIDFAQAILEIHEKGKNETSTPHVDSVIDTSHNDLANFPRVLL